MKRGFKVMAAALGAVLLLGAFAVGSALAADPPSGSSGTTNYYNVFVGKLAAALGIKDQATLTKAMTQAQSDTIDQMVKDGRITADQAKFMKDRAAHMQANGGPMGFGPGGFGGGPRFGGGSFGGPWGTPPWAATPTPKTQ